MERIEPADLRASDRRRPVHDREIAPQRRRQPAATDPRGSRSARRRRRRRPGARSGAAARADRLRAAASPRGSAARPRIEDRRARRPIRRPRVHCAHPAARQPRTHHGKLGTDRRDTAGGRRRALGKGLRPGRAGRARDPDVEGVLPAPAGSPVRAADPGGPQAGGPVVAARPVGLPVARPGPRPDSPARPATTTGSRPTSAEPIARCTSPRTSTSTPSLATNCAGGWSGARSGSQPDTPQAN